jgi:hypothetical protein
MTTPLFAYLAGVGSVVVALSAGFAGGAVVGTSFDAKPEIVAKTENPPMLITQRRETARVQAALDRAADDEKASAAKAIQVADERKIAAERKLAGERHKVVGAERRIERKKHIAIAAVRKELDAKAQADMVSPAFGYAPVASFQATSRTF